MVEADVRLRVSFDKDELPSFYLNEDTLAEAIREAIEAALERIGADEIIFDCVDVEGLEL